MIVLCGETICMFVGFLIGLFGGFTGVLWLMFYAMRKLGGLGKL